MPDLHTSAGLNAARTAVGTSFIVSGLAMASLFSRMPAFRETLGLSSAQLGLLLLCLSCGALVAMPLAGPIVQRLGAARAVLAGVLSSAVGMVVIAVGLMVGSVPFTAPGLMFIGVGIGVWDVAMNVHGAEVEQRLGRALMPRLHAGFSLGTVAGAGVGSAAAAVGLPLAVQLLVLAVLVAGSMMVALRYFLPAGAVDDTGGLRALQAWREPRTILIGLMALGFAFTEGTANDWMALAMVDGYGSSETVGALGFGLFVAAMTAGRFAGTGLLARFGRVAVLCGTATIGLGGLLLVVWGGSIHVAMVGAVLWGVGACLGYPIGMSAAADDPARAAVRVSVVGSIGYTAFLAGPPLIGALAQHLGILRALLVVAAALVLGCLASGAARPLEVGPARSAVHG